MKSGWNQQSPAPSQEGGLFLTGANTDLEKKMDPNILTSMPIHPQICTSIDPSSFKKLEEENKKLKEKYKTLEGSMKKYQSF